MSKRPISPESQTRNLFRAFFNSPRKRLFWREMQTLRRTSLPENYGAMCKVVEGNAGYSFPGLGNTFPLEQRDIPNSRYRLLQPLSLSKEVGLQIARLSHHKEKLEDSLYNLAEINRYINDRNFPKAMSVLNRNSHDNGLSFICVKKDLLVSLETGGLSNLAKRYTFLTSGHESTAWALLCHYVYDIMDPTYSPDQAVRRWRQVYLSRGDKSEWYCNPLRDDIEVVSRDEQSMATDLLRYSALSILDTCFWLWRKRMLNPDNTILSRAFEKLDQSILEILVRSFSHIDIVVPKSYLLSDKKPSDFEVFRTSFFFNEVADVAIWRSRLSKLIFTDKFSTPNPATDNPFDEIESSIRMITLKPNSCEAAVISLKNWELSFLSSLEDVSNQDFLKTVLVSASLRRLTPEIFPVADEVANLIASTQNIQMYVSIEVLEFLGRQAALQNSSLLQFVSKEMVYRKARTQDNELERRLSFMKMMNHDSYRSILKYIDHHLCLHRESAFLLAGVCTRGFLERLFLIMTSLKDVLECRLEIAEWLEKHSSEPNSSLEEERDALRRELSNLEARSDLDSTRVHVDEDSFRDWFKETQKARVARYSQTVLAEGFDREFESLITIYAHQERTTLNSPANKDEETEDLSADTRIGSEHLLVSIFDSAMRAFAFDRSFGLDAYLSRRIRHGTLSGHVITPLTRILNRVHDQISLFREYQQVEDIDPVSTILIEWRRVLISALDDLRKEVIQLQSSEHPRGLIRATWRTVGNIAHVDAMISRVRGRVLESRGSYDLFPDIYSLCWDCIEIDLAQLRFHMTREFLPKVAGALSMLDGIPPEFTRFTFGLAKELYVTLEARVQQVCGWLIRPVFRRDQYSLRMLVSSTLSIVRELDAKYLFGEEIEIEDDLALSRGSFDVFGDVLFILIGNGAKHGKADGKISVRAGRTTGNYSNVVVNVISEVIDAEASKNASARILDALQPKEASEIDRAAVEEGFSGLRKVAGLVDRLSSFGARLGYAVSHTTLEVRFTFTLPMEITLVRSTNL